MGKIIIPKGAYIKKCTVRLGQIDHLLSPKQKSDGKNNKKPRLGSSLPPKQQKKKCGITNKGAMFIADPIGESSTDLVCGVSPALKQRLEASGIIKAYQLLGQYLVLKKDERLFKGWLILEFKATVNQAKQVYGDLSEWADQFL